MSALRIAALDIGGTNIKACLFEDNEIINRITVKTLAERGANKVLESAAALLNDFRPFDAVGVSTAGQVDPESGIIQYANSNLPGYTGMDVRSYFEQRFSVPVAVVNDVYAAAIGEGISGAASGQGDYICVTYGTGIGGGVILGGKPYYGAGPSAGVMLGGLITHAEAISPEDPFSGSYERYASASALVSVAKKSDPALVDGRTIFDRLGELPVQAVVDCWLDEVATGLCTLIHTLNIPYVILGGGVMEQPYAIEGTIQRVSSRLIPGFRGVHIVKAKLGNSAGLYGAAHLAQQAEFAVKEKMK